MTSTRKEDDTAVQPVSAEAQLARYDAMIMAVPEATEDDGTGMVLQVLNATNWEAVNLGDKLPSFKDLIGKEFQVLAVERRIGDEQFGGGWYLVADCVDKRTGETFRAQTSAGVAMAQLVALHNLGAFPVILRVESANTRGGREAVNLRVLASGGKGR